MANASLSQLPLRFEANREQTDAQVRFASRGLRQQFWLTAEELDALPGQNHFLVGNDPQQWMWR
ncbi:MAG TPA: hypothetical protein PLK30_13295 [Blastocatellia bacterium]|nr:hypothetical protein [Blastocatellia bacterium]